MEIIIGFLIALAIGLTGVGGGVITAPVLILYVGLPPSVAVGTALAFVVIVKSLAVPLYLKRRQVSWRILRYMLLGGIPGALAGSVLLSQAASKNLGDLVLAVVGVVVIVSASLTLFRLALRRESVVIRERRSLLGVVSAMIGAEVGFSSAGAGALGTLALFRFSQLTSAEVVGTDLLFGFAVSLVGGALHFASGAINTAILCKLVAGGVVGVLAGAQLAAIFPNKLLRAAIAVLLVGLGAQLCLRGIAAMVKTG